MTFVNSFTQLNIENNNGFSNTCNSSATIVPNFWNNLPIFNFCNSFSLPSYNFSNFNFSNFNIFNPSSNWSNTFSWNNSINWNITPTWNTTLNWNTTQNYDNQKNNGSSRLTNSTNKGQDHIFKSNHTYANLTRQEALNKAQKDVNLEKLSGGNGWSISSSSFNNDIPYARKGTSQILSKVSSMVGKNLTITSALGTKNSPHVKSNGDASHYNSSNPKLDIGGGLSPSEAYNLKKKLLNTGYFSRVEVETHGSTAHLDVQIKDSAFTKLDTLA